VQTNKVLQEVEMSNEEVRWNCQYTYL